MKIQFIFQPLYKLFYFFFEVPMRFELIYHAFAERDFTCQTQNHMVDREGFEPPTLGSSGQRSTN